MIYFNTQYIKLLDKRIEAIVNDEYIIEYIN